MNLLITITRKTMCAAYLLSSTGLASLTKWHFKVSPFCHATSDCRLAIILPGFLVTNLAGEWVSSGNSKTNNNKNVSSTVMLSHWAD